MLASFSVWPLPPVGGHEPLDQPGSAGRLVAVEVRRDPALDLDPQLGGQSAKSAGVLGGDQVGPGQLLSEPWRRVCGLSDRGGREHEDAHADTGPIGHGPIMAGTYSCRP